MQGGHNNVAGLMSELYLDEHETLRCNVCDTHL